MHDAHNDPAAKVTVVLLPGAKIDPHLHRPGDKSLLTALYAAEAAAQHPNYQSADGWRATSGIATARVKLYHGTSLEKALSIQEHGFDVGLSGSTYKRCIKDDYAADYAAGRGWIPFPNESLLGAGIYATEAPAYAQCYATGGEVGVYEDVPENPHGGCVLELSVDLGKMHTITEAEAAEDTTTWGQRGFDSAYLHQHVPMQMSPSGGCSNQYNAGGEYCIADAKRIRVVGVQISDAARAAGWTVQGCKLCRLWNMVTRANIIALFKWPREVVLQTVAGDWLVVELSNAAALTNGRIGFKQLAAVQHPDVLSDGLLPSRGFLCCRSPPQHSTPWRLLLPRSSPRERARARERGEITNPNDVGAEKDATLTLATLARLQFDGQADNPILVVWNKEDSLPRVSRVPETSHSKHSVIPVRKMSSTFV